MPSGHCTEACYKLTAVDHLWRFSNKIRCCWFLCWPIGQICLQKRFIFLTCQEKPICSSFLTTQFSVANNFYAFNIFFILKYLRWIVCKIITSNLRGRVIHISKSCKKYSEELSKKLSKKSHRISYVGNCQ